jgi:polyhydroxyalkanoate synthesis regulator phasin
MNTLQYALFDNLLTEDSSDMMAVIQNQDTVDMDMLVDEMVAEGTGLTRPQAKAYSEKLFQLIKNHASAGRRINLPVVNIHSAIRGVFAGKDDRFDPARHRVVMLVSPGAELRRLEKEIKPEKVKGESPMPDPQDFIDAATGEHNRTITSGGIATLKGYHLKFDPSDSEQGLFLIPEIDSSTSLRVLQFSAIKPSELHFLVPQLLPGAYRIEVITYVRGGKQLRTGRLPELVETA